MIRKKTGRTPNTANTPSSHHKKYTTMRKRMSIRESIADALLGTGMLTAFVAFIIITAV